jgi:hypothetical protein
VELETHRAKLVHDFEADRDALETAPKAGNALDHFAARLDVRKLDAFCQLFVTVGVGLFVRVLNRTHFPRERAAVIGHGAVEVDERDSVCFVFGHASFITSAWVERYCKKTYVLSGWSVPCIQLV